MLILSMSVLVVLLALGAPIAFATLGSAVVYFAFSPIPNEVVIQQTVGGLESFPLLAVPFFVLAGSVMATSGIASRLYGFADSLVGHVTGGLAQVNVINSLLLGGMSGSANADAAIDARVIVPIMVKHGYGRPFASAVSTVSSVVTPIMPPGIGLILYGLLAQQSVGKLFMGGVIPALLLTAALMVTVRVISKKRGYGADRDTRPPMKEIAGKAGAAKWALLMPVLLLVGLRLGVFTPTELGALAVAYAYVVGLLLHREMNLHEVLETLKESVLTTSVIMLIIAGASGLSYIITVEQFPQRVIQLLSVAGDNPQVILAILTVVLLLLGTLFEGVALLIILTPILVPIVEHAGIDPIHFGVIFVINLTIAGTTPPVGTVLYTVCSITGTSVRDISRELIPFVVTLIGTLLLLVYVPWFTTVLPDLVYG